MSVGVSYSAGTEYCHGDISPECNSIPLFTAVSEVAPPVERGLWL